MKISERISIDPAICNGKLIIRGKRITVQTVLEYLGAGDKSEDILEQYPTLELDGIYACLKFASNLMSRNYTIRELIS